MCVFLECMHVRIFGFFFCSLNVIFIWGKVVYVCKRKTYFKVTNLSMVKELGWVPSPHKSPQCIGSIMGICVHTLENIAHSSTPRLLIACRRTCLGVQSNSFSRLMNAKQRSFLQLTCNENSIQGVIAWTKPEQHKSKLNLWCVFCSPLLSTTPIAFIMRVLPISLPLFHSLLFNSEIKIKCLSNVHIQY